MLSKEYIEVRRLVIIFLLLLLNSCAFLIQKDSFEIDEEYSEWSEAEGYGYNAYDYYEYILDDYDIQLQVYNNEECWISIGPPYLPIIPIFTSPYKKGYFFSIGLNTDNIDNFSIREENIKVEVDGIVQDSNVSFWKSKNWFNVNLDLLTNDLDTIKISFVGNNVLPDIVLYRTKKYYLEHRL
jgi:hypothetical protein